MEVAQNLVVGFGIEPSGFSASHFVHIFDAFIYYFYFGTFYA
jgi:hypothetical protein